MPPAERFITYPELPQYGVPPFTRKHLLDMQRRGQFPRAVQLSPNRIAWTEKSIQNWLVTRPVARSVREEGDAAA